MTSVVIHPDYNNIEYNNQYFEAYKRGVTGEPLIDACIRVYSPHKQIIDQDPDCIFIKKWIPELNTLTSEQMQNYTKISLNELTDGKNPVITNNVINISLATTVSISKYSASPPITPKSILFALDLFNCLFLIFCFCYIITIAHAIFLYQLIFL